MYKFIYRVQRISFGEFNTDTMNSCFEDGETLVAIVPLPESVRIVTMKRVALPSADMIVSEHE